MRGRWLTGTIVAAVLVLTGTSTALLLFDPRVTGAEALRTGGLAAGSIVGLYALWLNDRRRRVDERRQHLDHQRQELDAERYGLEQRRQELENHRASQDRERAADERFARAIELLGNDADQVRVGAMHSLAGLARSQPDYTQTVLDVLCSYLRRPFLHPRYAEGDASGWSQAETHEAERKLVVRLTAQRLIAELLPHAGDSGSPHYDLDLTGAILEYFDLSHRQIGSVVMRYTKAYSRNNLSGCEIHGPAWFTEMTTGTGRLTGRLFCSGTVFHDRAWFSKVTFADRVDFDGAEFRGAVKFRDASFAGTVSARGATFHEQVDLSDTAFTGDLHLNTTVWPQAVTTTGMTVDTTRHVELPAEWTGVTSATTGAALNAIR